MSEWLAFWLAFYVGTVLVNGAFYGYLAASDTKASLIEVMVAALFWPLTICVSFGMRLAGTKAEGETSDMEAYKT